MDRKFLGVLLLALLLLNCGQKPNDETSPVTPTKTEFDMWGAVSKDLNLDSSLSPKAQLKAIIRSQKYSVLLSQAEDLAGANYQKTQCGGVDGISEFLDRLVFFNYSGKRNDRAPGKVFVLKYHSQYSPSRMLYAFVTIPNAHGILPLTILSHESLGNPNGEKLGYNQIVNRLNSIQTKSVTALNAYPGDCLINKENLELACSTPVETQDLTYEADVNANLVLSDCMRKLVEQPEISYLDLKKLARAPSEPPAPNPIFHRLETDKNGNLKQRLFGFSYGGGVSLLTAAKAGMLISQMKKGKLSSDQFAPHYFEALGAAAPFGSMLLGEKQKTARDWLTKTLDVQGFYSIGFLIRAIGGQANLTNPAYLDRFELELAKTDSVFYSQYLHFSLRNPLTENLASINDGPCRVDVFYSEKDGFVNYPTTDVVLTQILKSTCPSRAVSLYSLGGSHPNPHWVWDLSVIRHTVNEVSRPESQNKPFYEIQNEWFDAI